MIYNHYGNIPNPIHRRRTDAGFKDIVAGAIEGAVLAEPDFIKNYVRVTRSDEPDRYGNYTYQWEITFATKEM